ncbi:cytosine permease [Streptomyces sp. HSG2]|uniref:purine-cytosine permease family protein n=1 Tax=Streptomyces sp. HSG2 TaxID=2797167 RepID=UPI001F5B39D5|nr:cytosine permease [Streptomyces sp. HSG2]
MRRVPERAKRVWYVMLVQRLGQLSALTQFMIGTTLGMGMTFRDAVIAITIGSVFLELVTILTGIAGMREGLPTALLARWTGFGGGGSAIVGLVIVLTTVGWFGIQNTFLARSLERTVGGPQWAWCLLGGAIVIAVVVYGFASMTWVAFAVVPLFLALIAFTVLRTLNAHSPADLVTSPPPGSPLTIGAGATLVAGGFIVGAIFTPDMTRFNRSASDVVKQTVVGVTVGEYTVCLSGVLLAHATGSSDIVAIVLGSGGVVAAVIVITAVLKVNDWNLYASSLATVNSVDVLFGGRRPSRVVVAVTLGSAGSALSAVGIIEQFTPLLTAMGVVLPPVAGIMIAEYFVVRTWRGALDDARRRGELPAEPPRWSIPCLAVWAASAAGGHWLQFGVPALNSIALAFGLYSALGRLGSTGGTRGTRSGRTA